MSPVRAAAIAFVAIVCLAVPAAAWKGEGAGLVRPIAEVAENAESGDFVAVEGTVVEKRTGNGGLIVLRVEDVSGELWVAVPEHVYRDLGNDPLHKRARFVGKWDHQYMDDDVWGIRVQHIEPVAAPAAPAD